MPLPRQAGHPGGPDLVVDPLLPFAADWTPFAAFRIRAKAEDSSSAPRSRSSNAARSSPRTTADGYDFFDLVESSKYPPGRATRRSWGSSSKHIRRPKLARLVREILEENAELFQKMPAAQSLHHGFSGGLVEHIWSVTRVCTFLSGTTANITTT